MGSHLQFVKAALKNPFQISTLFQTSPWLANHLLNCVGIETSKFVIELGPGAGAITQELVHRLPQSAKYIGLELNSDLTLYLQNKFPQLEFLNESAEACATVALKRGAPDTVVSSLPWTMFPFDLQEAIVKSISGSLSKGGKFATYVCVNAALLPSAKNLKKLLDANFTNVERSRIEIRNIPPAFVYTCTK